MLNLKESDIEFIKDNISEDSILLQTNDIGIFLDALDEWIAQFGWDETGENLSDLGREAQRIYDYVYYELD